ncbi:RNA polymerase II C-terminal domain kinase beta subunit, partial [Ascosphaera pollenicola]
NDGIIRVGFLQTLATWYLRATGGTASTTIASLSTQSVQVMKRSMQYVNDKVPAAAPISRVAKRGASIVSHYTSAASKRSDEDSTVDPNDQTIVRGIERVGFRANMETTNIFLTGFIFFIVFVFVVIALVLLFKGFCEIATKKGWIKSNKFQEFRRGWKVVLRGILYRLTIIGYPQMCTLCLWEFTCRDSPAEVVLAVFMLVALNASLYWAAFKVIMLAKKSTQLYKNPAYILYSDPAALNKWGFLYVNYRATAYYCVLPFLGYHFVKSMFVGLSQHAQVVQAIALLVIETFTLICVSVLRPWMDKKTNIFNIAIAAVNFVDVILLLFFSNVFHQPGLVTGVMGVIFFVINVVFAFILLISVIASSAYAIISKNPDRRYQPMRDDRGSFMKDDNGHPINTELDALGATARDMGAPTEMLDLKNATTTNTSSSVTPMKSGGGGSQTALDRGDSHVSDGSEQYAYAQYPPQHPQSQQQQQLPNSMPLFPAVGGGMPDDRFRRSPGPEQQHQPPHHQQYSAFPSGGNEYGNDMWR